MPKQGRLSPAGAGRKEPGAPPAALLLRDGLHWLVTDGADPALFDWPGGKPGDIGITLVWS